MLRRIRFIEQVAQREIGEEMSLESSCALDLVKAGKAEFCANDPVVMQTKAILPKPIEVIKPKAKGKK